MDPGRPLNDHRLIAQFLDDCCRGIHLAFVEVAACSVVCPAEGLSHVTWLNFGVPIDVKNGEKLIEWFHDPNMLNFSLFAFLRR